MQRTLTTLLGLAVGVAMLTGPDLTNIGSDAAYNSAFAAKGGNGKGNGKSGGGSTGSSSNSKSASVGKALGKSKTKTNHGSVASSWGALNAANASAQALANPNPKSRLGRIKNAVVLSAAATAGQEAADAAVQQALNTNQAVIDARKALEDAKLLGDPIAIATAETNLKAATDAVMADPALAEAQKLAADAMLEADAAWEAAANKPLTDEIKAAVTEMVQSKIAAPEVTDPEVTPDPEATPDPDLEPTTELVPPPDA